MQFAPTSPSRRIGGPTDEMPSYLSNANVPATQIGSSRIGRSPVKTWSIKKMVVGDHDANLELKKPMRSRSRARSKSRARSVARKRSVSRARKKGPRPSDYESWDFGKPKKNVVKAASTPKNNKYATTIQRIMRGWWVRINFKFVLYKYRLSHKAELTVTAIEQVEKQLEKQKKKERQKMVQAAIRARKEATKSTKEEDCVEQGRDLIAYLRKENKKLRDKNEKIISAARGIQAQNERLEGVNTKTDGNMDILNAHAKQIQDTYDKLVEVEPKYKSSVEQLSTAVEDHRQHCLVEHTIKLLYAKLIGTVVEMLDERSDQSELKDQVLAAVVEIEGKDNDMELPDELPSGTEATRLLSVSPLKSSSSKSKGKKKPDKKKVAAPKKTTTTTTDSDSDSDSSSSSDDSSVSSDSSSDSDSENYDEYSVAVLNV